MRRAIAAAAACLTTASAFGQSAPAGRPLPVTPPAMDYLVYVGSEGVDQISLVRFGPGGARVDHVIKTGRNPTELVGPHGLGVSPDGKYYFVSTAHGTPYGSLWRYTTAGDSLRGVVVLGNFPATLQVTPDGAFVYVVNFNLYGDPVPSSVSVVYADGMQEVARITTCVMPHGSRFNPQGTKHYSACMMDDMVVEIDTRALAIARHFIVTPGHERGEQGAPPHPDHASAGSPPAVSHSDMGGHPMPTLVGSSAGCSPTWAQPSADGSKLYVACNKSNDVVEIDVRSWAMTRRIPMGDGVYNLAATHDGRLLIGTNKRNQSVSVVELASGKEVARIATLRKVVHGVAVSPDDRYAFVSVEGVGSQPGTVEVIDLAARQRVAAVDVGPQAGGIDFWKTQPAH